MSAEETAVADNLNLTPERGPNVWSKTAESGRWKAGIGGGLLLAAGVAASIVGGKTLYCALAGNRGGTRISGQHASDEVMEESMESVPASDAPSWTSAGATLDKRRNR